MTSSGRCPSAGSSSARRRPWARARRTPPRPAAAPKHAVSASARPEIGFKSVLARKRLAPSASASQPARLSLVGCVAWLHNSRFHTSGAVKRCPSGQGASGLQPVTDGAGICAFVGKPGNRRLKGLQQARPARFVHDRLPIEYDRLHRAPESALPLDVARVFVIPCVRHRLQQRPPRVARHLEVAKPCLIPTRDIARPPEAANGPRRTARAQRPWQLALF